MKSNLNLQHLLEALICPIGGLKCWIGLPFSTLHDDARCYCCEGEEAKEIITKYLSMVE